MGNNKSLNIKIINEENKILSDKIKTKTPIKTTIKFIAKGTYKLGKYTVKQGLNKTGINEEKVDVKNLSDTGSQSFYYLKDKANTLKKGYRNVKSGVKGTIKTVRVTRKIGTEIDVVTKNSTIKTARNTQKAIQATARTIQEFIRTVKLMSNPLVIKSVAIAGLVILSIIMAITIISSITSSMSIIMPMASVPITDEDLIIKFGDKLKQLDSEANQELSRLKQNNGYDDIVFYFNGDESSVFSNIQDFLILLAVLEEQDIDESKMTVLEMIHNLSYEIETKEEFYYELEMQYNPLIGEEELVEVQKIRLIITLSTYNFEQLQDLVKKK